MVDEMRRKLIPRLGDRCKSKTAKLLFAFGKSWAINEEYRQLTPIMHVSL